MKVCEKCGIEIWGPDYDGECPGCEIEQRKRARALRRARESVLRDLGLVKVRGSMGGTYWE